MYKQTLSCKRWKYGSGWVYSEFTLDEWGSTAPFETTEEQLADEITGYADEWGLKEMLDRLESEGIDERYTLREFSPDGKLIARLDLWETDAISNRLARIYAGTAPVNR